MLEVLMGIRLIFVYPNREELECQAELGETIYDAAVRSGIQMDSNFTQSCLVQIELKEGTVAQPNDTEKSELSMDQLDKRYRFANTYEVAQELNNALIFLNLIRVHYKDRNNNLYTMHAIATEPLMSVRDRHTDVIDLSFSCHGALACSTCHCVIDVSDQVFETLGKISPDEEDLMYYCNPEDHSRLGCQIRLRPDLDGIKIRHPKANKDV
jgi:ferredoxin, 2Fe-2S